MEQHVLSVSRGKQVHIVEPCQRLRAELARTCYALGYHCELYADMDEMAAHRPRLGIIVARDDAENGGVSLFLERLLALGIWLPVIATQINPRPTQIVQAIKCGAIDYLALPIDSDRFERCLARVSKEAEDFAAARRRTIDARSRLATLSGREFEVLEHLTAGESNKVIARELEISPRTVEIHRANMMSKLHAKHAAEAVRLRLEANLAPVIAAM